MTKEENLSLERMRQERITCESVYMKFVNNGKYYKSHAFCFYEGEDGKYYDSRIRKKFQDNMITYPVGNKKEVLKLLNKVRSAGLYEGVCTMFFIDRDYDESLAGTDEDLFETPCYSIENLYTQKECLKKILQSEFGLNIMDADYQKCLQDFQLREDEFIENILEFNSLVYLRRKKTDSNSNYSFSSVKTSHLVKIDVERITKSSKYEETINGIKDRLQFNETEMREAQKELLEKGNFSLNFRGKNQLDFFVGFIKNLKQESVNGGYFASKHNGVHIDITANRLSELSQYAVTPPILEEFLENHRFKVKQLTLVS